MPLVPYEPFRPFETMRRELERMLTAFPGYDHAWGLPRIDVHETETEVVATCDLPGLEKKEDVNIHIDDQLLTISGSVNRVNEVREEQMHRRERFIGRFHRSVNLPARVSPEGVRATYKNGVLEVRMPKQQADEKRRIDVEFH